MLWGSFLRIVFLRIIVSVFIVDVEYIVLGRVSENGFFNFVVWSKIDYDSGKLYNIILDIFMKYNIIYLFKLVLMYFKDI